MSQARLKIDILTLFPNLFEGPLNESMMKQAQKRGHVEIKIHNLRDYAQDKRKTCDDKPFGGGAGMVIMVGPIHDCLSKIGEKGHRILVSPRGKVFNHDHAKKLSKKHHLVFICGHYEGVDERVHDHLIDEEISVGDFVTTGGEFPALCLIDAIIRLVPGVLGNEASLDSESFSQDSLDYPQYTKPREFQGWAVPDVLFSGNHRMIESWRKKRALEITQAMRPDLIKKTKS